MVGSPAVRRHRNGRTSRRDDGHPSQSSGKELRCTQSPQGHDSGHQPHQLTSTSSSEKTQAQSASIPSANSPCDDSCHLPFDTLHHDSQHSPFSGFPHHPDTNDGAGYPPRSSTQSKAEVNFGRMCRSHTPMGYHPTHSQPLFTTVFPASKRLYPFHPHWEYATQILH